MSAAVQLGPLLLPANLLLVVGCAGATLAMGRWLGRDRKAEVESALMHAFLVGAVVARLAFVVEYRSLYLSAPLTLLDIRDGGWNATFGLIGAWVAALHRERKHGVARKPLRWSMTLGTSLFAAGTLALALQADTGRPLPSLTFAGLDGRTTVRLDQFAGQPTVINLWATWCPPCVREMPILAEAQREHPQVHFVFLNQGEAPAHVAAWLESQQLQMSNVLIDERRQASAYFHQKGYPTTLFFDAKGTLVSTRVGELSAGTLRARLDELPPNRQR